MSSSRTVMVQPIQQRAYRVLHPCFHAGRTTFRGLRARLMTTVVALFRSSYRTLALAYGAVEPPVNLARRGGMGKVALAALAAAIVSFVTFRADAHAIGLSNG